MSVCVQALFGAHKINIAGFDVIVIARIYQRTGFNAGAGIVYCGFLQVASAGVRFYTIV